MRILSYDRMKAVDYALKWATSRNPVYYDFSLIGGDCTSFASQCLYSGAPQMNYAKDVGWYYQSVSNRASAWSGVDFFYKFIVGNQGVGPFGEIVNVQTAEVGDFIQLQNSDGRFYHTLVITEKTNGIFVSAHSFDARNRLFNAYFYNSYRVIKIMGYRKW